MSQRLRKKEIRIPMPKILTGAELEYLQRKLMDNKLSQFEAWALYNFCVLQLNVQADLINEIVTMTGEPPQDIHKVAAAFYQQRVEQMCNDLNAASTDGLQCSETPAQTDRTS